MDKNRNVEKQDLNKHLSWIVIFGVVFLIIACIGLVLYLKNPIDDQMTGNQASGNLSITIFFGISSILCFFGERKRKEKEKRVEEQRIKMIEEKQYLELEMEVLKFLGFSSWNIISSYSHDERVTVKSRQALEKYDYIKFFKENKEKLDHIEKVIEKRGDVLKILKDFLINNEYKTRPQYNRLEQQIYIILRKTDTYKIQVNYISPAGNNLGTKTISITRRMIDELKKDQSLLMGKAEYNQYLKQQQKEVLDKKHSDYYTLINRIIDYANVNKEYMVIKRDKERLDDLMTKLFDRTINSVKKIKDINSEEWEMMKNFIGSIMKEIQIIVDRNSKIIKYYRSPDFIKIQETCQTLMSTQKEFNEYIDQKAKRVSSLFGSRVVRSETINNDEYNYIRQYKKTITPFTAEVSATVFESAERNPLEYVVKYFYPNKELYPEQIQKLHMLVEELETLREAKQIIDKYKVEYKQYIGSVPDYIMEEDEDGFYSRLGFANIDESVLTVEYKFSYTSAGGMAQRTFTVPMTEETIVELIKLLESKLTIKAFAKEQRSLMTKKLREFIKTRDNFTCCNCGNSTYEEPNLLLEIDHIIPIAKGGCTVKDNLQTLCWKCNRSKSDKTVF